MTALPTDSMLRAPAEGWRGFTAWVGIALWCAALLLVVGLFGRIMTFPLNHDEQIHVVAARFFLREPLYGSLGYNHLPGLPLLLGSFYAVTGSDHFLQAGRVLIFLRWVATATIMWAIARHHTKDDRIAAIAILVLSAGTLLGPTGMLVTNNLLPVPFALLGIHAFIVALEGERVRPWPLFLAGAAIGFAVTLKISYVFLLPPVAVAALLVPGTLSFGRRIRLVLLPLLAGGIVGGMPVLVVLVSDPAGLFAHTVRYFTGGHLAYWQHSADPKAMALGEKILVAEEVWLGGGGLLAVVLAGTAGVVLRRDDRAAWAWWPIPFVAVIAACGAASAFLPTPAFPQYYTPPIPFLLLLFLLLYRKLDENGRSTMAPVLLVVAALALTNIVPRLLPALPDALRPARWTGNVLHAEGQRIRAALGAGAAAGRVATLSPIVAIEGNIPIYPEFAAGPFLYRVADYLSASDRVHFRTTSPRHLRHFLDAHPPVAIITGREAELDQAFVAYARSRHYRAIETGDPQTRLFLRAATATGSSGLTL